MKHLLVVFTEILTWYAIFGADVSWSESLPLQNTLHHSDYPNRTTPSSTSCIALGTSTPGCSHVTYVYSTSTCHLHSKLQGRQSTQNSRVWSMNTRCPADLTYSERMGACIFVSTDSMTWGAALTDCQTRKARLLVTLTTSKIEAVENEITEDAAFWIGGTVSFASATRWITGEAVDFSDFTFIHNYQAYLESCLLFLFLDTDDLVLTYDECGTKFRYICEAI